MIEEEEDFSSENAGQIWLIYTNTSRLNGEASSHNYAVSIVKTACNYGGYRYWFRCPLSVRGTQCNKRIGVLYKVGKYFGCRSCGRLVYAEQNISKKFRGIVADSDVEEAYGQIKRFYYRGKTTKKHRKYLKKQERNDDQCSKMLSSYRK